MRRIRWLRLFVLVVLAGLVVTVGLAVRRHPQRGVVPAAASTDDGARMEGFRFTDLVEGRRRLLVEAGLGTVDGQGAFKVEDVRRAEVDREKGSPLILAAPHGTGSGTQGRRVMRLEGGVTMRDDDLGMTLSIPTVEVDQINGVVRSIGDVAISGPRWKGSASAIVHSLTGAPAEIYTLVVDGTEGEHLEAHKATLEVATHTLTLEGDVRASQRGFSLAAPRIVLVQEPGTQRLRHAEADTGVSGSVASLAGGAGSFAAQRAEASWGADGALSGFVLAGGARIEHVKGTLLGDRIEASSPAPDADASLHATGQVVASGALARGVGRVSCEDLAATLSAKGEVRSAEAKGDVRFDGDGTSGEGAAARFTPTGKDGALTLESGPDRRARVANGRTRVAAETIVGDLRGTRFEAKGHVESTLLPDPARKRSAPLFDTEEAVHFVSASLTSESGGAVLVFKGEVRGWQGERSLAAASVEMHQDGPTLDAAGGVTTRLPKEQAKSTVESDYVQVTADTLAYRGVPRTATYDGNVRVRQAEGWLEAPRLEAQLGDGGRGLRAANATGGVRFEYRARAASGAPTTATGRGDRAVYDALAKIVRLIGEKTPATVVATGAKAGTTAGRVLRYELETGALEVEAGERDRATINTPTE